MKNSNFPSFGNWTKEQLKVAFHYYCQSSFGKLHSRNPEIIKLAGLINRTPSALAMKLVNFASLDPSITRTGRKGLKGSSKLDREIWDEFHNDWEGLAYECENLLQSLSSKEGKKNTLSEEESQQINGFAGETKEGLVKQRIRQAFFRRVILSSYRERCCISGLSEPKLLIASHIVPWSIDKSNRLNPRNGLCLSVIHDKAFDQGFIALSNNLEIILSEKLLKRDDDFIEKVFLPIKNKPIEIPEKFSPDPRFIEYHRNNIFIKR